MPYKLTVNGRPATVDAPADMPLLWVIRDVLNLRGTKYGCGIGQCGACTVHIGGRAVRSCQAPISTAENAKITTIEGLSPDGSHPVQLAWADLDVPQCGYEWKSLPLRNVHPHSAGYSQGLGVGGESSGACCPCSGHRDGYGVRRRLWLPRRFQTRLGAAPSFG